MDYYKSELFNKLFKVDNGKVIQIKDPLTLPKNQIIDIWQNGAQLLIDSKLPDSYYITLDFGGMHEDNLTPFYHYHYLTQNYPNMNDEEESYHDINDAINELNHDISEYIANLLSLD